MSHTPDHPGTDARAAGHTLTSTRVAALPVLDRFLRRLHLDEFLRGRLPREDRRARIPTATALLLLLENLLVCREPLYGVGEWAARHDPARLGLTAAQLPALNDDRVGRALDRLFDADVPALTLEVVAHAVREFGVELDELHNDSTTVTFHGDYETADRERTLRGRLRLAVTHGHNKDHRPDLKQLLYILTVSRDGAVPVQFRVESGNATDDRSHQKERKGHAMRVPASVGPALPVLRPSPGVIEPADHRPGPSLSPPLGRATGLEQAIAASATARRPAPRPSVRPGLPPGP